MQVPGLVESGSQARIAQSDQQWITVVDHRLQLRTGRLLRVAVVFQY